MLVYAKPYGVIPEDHNLVWHGPGPISVGEALCEGDNDLSGLMNRRTYVLEQMMNYHLFKKYVSPCK